MPPFAAFWLHHSTPRETAAEGIRAAVCDPAFKLYSWAAMIQGDKHRGRTVKTEKSVERHLHHEKSDGLVLEDGGRDRDSYARFRFDRDPDNPYPAPHSAVLTCPYQEDAFAERLAVFKMLAVSVGATLGYVSLEPSPREAQGVALGSDNRVTRARDDISEIRRRERKSQLFNIRGYATKLPAVHWGMFLSSGHLATVPLGDLTASAFHLVEPLAPGLVYLQLSPDPRDCLSARYEQQLAEARAVLAPLMIDVSEIKLTPRS